VLRLVPDAPLRGCVRSLLLLPPVLVVVFLFDFLFDFLPKIILINP
jgi:hypothetical protein